MSPDVDKIRSPDVDKIRSPDVDKIRISNQKLATIIGRSERTIRKDRDKGWLPKTEKGRGTLAVEIIKSIYEKLIELADQSGRRSGKPVSRDPLDDGKPKDFYLLEKEQAWLEKRIRNHVAAGNLVQRHVYLSHVAQVGSAASRMLEALSGQLKAKMPELTPQGLEYLQSEHAKIAEAISNGKWDDD